MLVVGATRILRPALHELRARGDVVFGLARGAAALQEVDGARPVVADLTSVASVRAALRELPRFDAALVYAPRAAAGVLPLFAAQTDGPLVEIFTSRWADPSDGRDGDPATLPSVGVPLLLGWTSDGSATRWHTPVEISRAALDVLASGRPAVLGTVRPWTARPGQAGRRTSTPSNPGS